VLCGLRSGGRALAACQGAGAGCASGGLHVETQLNNVTYALKKPHYLFLGAVRNSSLPLYIFLPLYRLPLTRLPFASAVEESGSEGLEEFVSKAAGGFLSDVAGICISDNYWLSKSPCVT
jgi:hypothetical protein